MVTCTFVFVLACLVSYCQYIPPKDKKNKTIFLMSDILYFINISAVGIYAGPSQS